MTTQRERLELALSVVSGRKGTGDLNPEDLRALDFDFEREHAEDDVDLQGAILRRCERCVLEALDDVAGGTWGLSEAE